MITRLYIASVIMLISFSTSAKDYYYLIGGGPYIANSQSQIEYNVKWVHNIIKSKNSDADISVFFTDGESDLKDIYGWNPVNDDDSLMQPVSRVFGYQVKNGEIYSNTQLDIKTNSTEKELLVETLKTRFKSAETSDRIFIIYNGHGLRDNENIKNSYLHLWNDSRLTISELENLLSNVKESIPVTFILTQCFSGTFRRLIYNQADIDSGLNKSLRCGFMAESEYDEAEGCSASINTGDYRDYTTYFFSALSGKDRFNNTIEGDTDLDGDNELTMYDAHLYTLKNAYNSDIPRSTSETYLEEWEPWYLQWYSRLPAEENAYSKIADHIANRLFKDGEKMDIAKRKKELIFILKKLKQDKNSIIDEAIKIQDDIKKQLLQKWPEARHPYTDNYRNYIVNNAAASSEFIKNHKDYDKLVELQDKQLEYDDRILKAQRDITQLDKLMRIRKISRLLSVFKSSAGDVEKNDYEKLLGCEKNKL